MKIQTGSNFFSSPIVLALVVVAFVIWALNYHPKHAKNIPTPPKCEQGICSAWLQAQMIPSASRHKIIQLTKNDLRTSHLAEFNQLNIYQPKIIRLCREYKVNPWLIDGLILQESSANKFAVDYAYADGLSNRTFVGLGQFSYDELHGSREHKQQVIRLAKEWRAACRHRDFVKAHILLTHWASVDPRFNPDQNLQALVLEVKQNTNIDGNVTLAIMAHHGGSNDPLRRVAYYRRDYNNVPYSNHPMGIARYVKKHHLNYFILATDHGPGRKYWLKKKDGHLNYGYDVAAKAEAFYRFVHHLPLKPHPKRVRSFLFIKNSPTAYSMQTGLLLEVFLLYGTNVRPGRTLVRRPLRHHSSDDETNSERVEERL